MPMKRADFLRLKAKWEKLTIKDSYIFGRTLELSDTFCCWLLSRIIKKPIKKEDIVYLESERSLKSRRDSKGVRLDVYVEENGAKRVYDVEMQVANEKNLMLRTRYYQATIDTENLDKGKTYHELPEMYIIFICAFDPFGKGRHIYTIRPACTEDKSVACDDKTAKIFLNIYGTADDVDAELLAFLDYVAGKAPRLPILQEVDEMVTNMKRDRKWRADYMRYEQEVRSREYLAREEGRMEGRMEGETSTSISLIKNLMAKMRLTAQQAMESLGIPLDKQAMYLPHLT